MLDREGLGGVKIFVTGGLDEMAIERLVKSGAAVDAVGVGTKLGVSEDAPYLDSVYKLVEYAGRPVMKLSVGKETLPGAKQVFRSEDMRDVVGLRDEEGPEGTTRLLELVMSRGRRVSSPPTLQEARSLFESDLLALPPRFKQLEGRPGAPPGITDALRTLAESAAAAAGGS
jgi:nicotinate phosphoribosyltransferase